MNDKQLREALERLGIISIEWTEIKDRVVDHKKRLDLIERDLGVEYHFGFPVIPDPGTGEVIDAILNHLGLKCVRLPSKCILRPKEQADADD